MVEFFPCCTCAVAFPVLLSWCCMCKPCLCCYSWFSWPLVWEPALFSPPFSYSWIVTSCLEEHVWGLNNLIGKKETTGRMSKAVELLQENMGSEGEHAALERDEKRMFTWSCFISSLTSPGGAFPLTSSFSFFLLPKSSLELMCDTSSRSR